MRTVSPIIEYEGAIRRLRSSPQNQNLQHRAVLALARAGSLEFALSEFARYGLDKVRHHEDIQGLGGRLQKDRYLASSGRAAQDHARQSAELYEQAYQDSGGYYSGINSATMALLAGASAEIYQVKARDLLSIIPESGHSRETKYYIEATRAEAFLLLGEIKRAQMAMRQAWDHDPLNYTAHASTLKQFRLIHRELGLSDNWLSTFEPPKSIHFAGHLFHLKSKGSGLSNEALATLKGQISDLIQTEDIGFGYGALAAGSDIVIAEGLIEEGAELHVILPVEEDIFKAKSVFPFGPEWEERFHACMSAASSVEVISDTDIWPDDGLDRFSGRMAMGHAVMRAQHLSVAAQQVVIWDGLRAPTGTAADALIWKKSGRVQHVIPFNSIRTERAALESALPMTKITMAIRGQDECQAFNSVDDAAYASAQEIEGAGLAIGLEGQHLNSESLARELAEAAVPGGVLMSEGFACHLALENDRTFTGDYMGRIGPDRNGPRVFALKPKSGFE